MQGRQEMCPEKTGQPLWLAPLPPTRTIIFFRGLQNLQLCLAALTDMAWDWMVTIVDQMSLSLTVVSLESQASREFCRPEAMARTCDLKATILKAFAAAMPPDCFRNQNFTIARKLMLLEGLPP